jgi:hypothetical protein
LNGSKQTLPQSGNGIFELEGAAREEGLDILHSYFALLALRHRRLLIAAALLSMTLVYCLTRFMMHPKYEATAVIRPNGQNPNSIGGLLQSAGMTSNTLSGTGIDSDIGTNIHDPDELVTILTSYTFTTAMIQAEHLEPKLSGGWSIWSLVPTFLRSRPAKGSPQIWSYYLALRSRFDCQNSVRTGNITLTFIDKNPEFARHILQLYIDRLRDQLRTHDVVYSKAAAKSLQEEAATVSDPMLRDDLYDLAARQIKKMGTAQANADFAFTVLEKPYVPPYPVKPWVLLDMLFAGIAIPVFIFAVLVVRDWAPRVTKDLAEAAWESERIPESIALSRRSRPIPTPEENRPYSR